MKKYCLSQLLLTIIIILSSSLSSFSQEKDCNYKKPHQADTWIFGKKARIDFTQDPPTVNPTGSDYAMPSGSSVISDNDGKMLLFSNGKTIWNKQYQVMSGGTGLNGALLGGQTSLIVPHPGNSKKYFVFTTNMYYPGILTDGVNYNVVDFSSNSNGTVTSKNNFLFNENTKSMCAIKHQNNEYYWIIFHGFGSSKGGNYYAYLIDTSGVVSSPVVSNIGYHQQGDLNNQVGYMKASSDGSRVAITIPVDGVVEVLEFDNATGKLSSPITSSTSAFYLPFGAEFSPNNEKLYICTTPKVADTSYIYQFDITNNNPFSNPIVISKFAYNATTTDSTYQSMQLSVDGKIYVTKTMESGGTLPNLGVIYNPDRNGLGCNYNELNQSNNNGLPLAGAGSQAGLPDFVSSFLDIPHFFYLDQCKNDTTIFEIRNKANLTPTWDFNDPSGNAFLSEPMKPGYIFSDAGTFQVELTESYAGEDYVFSEEVIIHPLPSIDIGQGSDIIYILPNSSIRLDAGAGYDIYNWIPSGSTNQYLDVNQEGTYIVSVTDLNCCTNSDTVEIKFAKLAYPTAFNPNSSITDNRTFKVFGNVGAISKYQMIIFNRWGQLIFESDDPTEGWDGTYNGSAAPLGTYVYSSVFTSFESGIQSSIDIKNKGIITLIR